MTRSPRYRIWIRWCSFHGSRAWHGCRPTTYFQGQPYPLNTRVALKQVQAEAAKLGFGMNLGIECEVYLLRQNADGTLSIPNADDRLAKPCYDLRGFLHNLTWLDQVASCMNDLGWDLYSFDHEDGNGRPTSSISSTPMR